MRKFVLLAVLAVVCAFAWHEARTAHSAPSSAALDRRGDRLELVPRGAPVTLVHFWGTWCAPCRDELPAFIAFTRAQQGKGVRLIAVARDASFDDVDGYLRRSKLQFDTLLDPTGATLAKWGVDGIPTTIVFDRKGRELARYVGGQQWDSPEMERELARVTSGTL